jgi:hypothetical protein
LLHPSQDAVRVHFTPFPDLLESKSVMRSRPRREPLAPEIAQKVLVYQVESDWAAEISLAAQPYHIGVRWPRGLLACLSQVREIEAYVT